MTMWIKTDALMRELGQKKSHELTDRIVRLYKNSPFVKQYYTELLVEPGSATRIVKANDLINYLRSKDKNLLISEILRLYKANTWVQDYCALWLSVVSTEDMLANYQQRLKKSCSMKENSISAYHNYVYQPPNNFLQITAI